MKCLQPRRIVKNLDPVKYPQGLLVPCGQCMNCRLQKREEWVLRIIHESESWDSCIFLTLTYSDDNLPENGSLVKADLQNFFKRIRKNGKKSIKYFACGEYGEESARPHYHCLIFGLDYLNPDDIWLIKNCWKFCEWEMLGNKPFGDITMQSIRYTVGYMEKTILGKEEKYAYDDFGIIKPFHILSNGLGKRYAIKNKKDMESNGRCTVSGYKKAIPRYYSDVAGISREVLQGYAEDKEKEVVESITGINATRDELYLFGSVDSVLTLEGTISKSNVQHDINLKARSDVNTRRRKRDT